MLFSKKFYKSFVFKQNEYYAVTIVCRTMVTEVITGRPATPAKNKNKIEIVVSSDPPI
jgi:hypothetical protein